MTQLRDGWDGHLSVTTHPYVPNTSRELKTSLRTHSQVISIFHISSSQKYQIHSTTSYSGIIPHQTSTQIYYLLDIVTSSILDTTEGITKANVTKQSGNWERWYTFLTHTGVTNKFLNRLPQGEKKIMVASFAASVQRNQFGATRKPKLLHGTVKAAVLGLSTSFRTHLWGEPTLDVSGQRSLGLQQQLRGYKSVDPPTKHQKAILAKLVFHIYKKKYSHLSTAIRKLISGEFFFDMKSCKYSTTPKGGHKRTCILRKGGIKFYRKRRKLSHSSRRLHLSDKVSPTFWTQKWG